VLEHGKPVVLNFWAGQCPPCRAEMPAFQEIADEYQDKFILVGIDIGVFTGLGSHDDALNLLNQLRIRYPASYAADATPVRAFAIRSMPTTIFLDAKGRVVENVEGMLVEELFRRKVENLIARS
jgi:thiol-disulfide isomerase/thioredoxin